MKNLIIFFTMLSAISCTSQNATETTTKRVSNEEWKERISQVSEPLLVDVRTPKEFNAGHFEGAINIDFRNADFMKNMSELDKDRTLFIYCHSGGRSGQACTQLESAGFKDIVELKGGYSNWGD
jgi:rhodanese-related sulfurtransferase